MSKCHSYQEMVKDQRSLAQQLHDMRISKQLSLEQVHGDTHIPMHVIDNQETGRVSINMAIIYQLAKYYGKKVRISLED